MRWLVDTNILLRFPKTTQVDNHVVVRRAVSRLLRHGDELFFCPGIVREYWNVATRQISDPIKECPQCGRFSNGGFGRLPEIVHDDLEEIEKHFNFLPEDKDVYSKWKSIVSNNQIVGRNVHDMGWLAVMKAHHITKLLTIDGRLKGKAASVGIELVTAQEIADSSDYPEGP